MRQFHWLRFLLTFFLLFAWITPCVSAFTVSSVNVDPGGYQAAGTPMTVNAAIDFSSEDADTFPASNELQLSTNLIEPHWVPVLVLDGVETNLLQKNGESLTIPGWYLSYPSRQNVQLKVTLTGTIPANPSPGRNFLKIQEVESSSRVVSTARLEMPEAPVTTLSTPSTPSTLATPTKKPTTKKIFTPIPIDTPTQESPIGTGAGIMATTGAALLVIKRR